jgi:hypothetical protein
MLAASVSTHNTNEPTFSDGAVMERLHLSAYVASDQTSVTTGSTRAS